MRQKLLVNQGRKIVAFSSGLLLTVLLMMIVMPIAPQSSFAADTDAVTLEAGVNLGSNISLAIQSSLDIDVIPSADITYNKNSAVLTVTTNNSSGYSLFMQAIGDSADLINTDLTVTDKIQPVQIVDMNQLPTLEQLQPNTWGYNLERTGNLNKDRTYQPVSTAITKIYETGGTTYRDEYALTFGVATRSDLSNGRYTREVLISATANPTVITSLNQAEYMQDVTSDICKNTDTHVTKRLTDYRDGKKYWVAKLKDNNCWMTQNLALTLKDFDDGEGIRAVMADGVSKGTLLTPANTDIEEDWNLNSAYPPKETSVSPFVSPANTADSWDFGEYVWTKPTSPADCGEKTGIDPISKCSTSIGFVNVSNKSEWQASNSKIDSGDIAENGVYDAHYLVGNYYTFTAATAGKGPTVTSSQAKVEESICPKNWKLPTAGSNYNNANDSWYNLLKAYGAETSNATSSAILRAQPLYVVFNGYVAGGNGGPFNDAGSRSSLWSSISSSVSAAYYLDVERSSLTPSYSYSRQYSYSIRCLAR